MRSPTAHRIRSNRHVDKVEAIKPANITSSVTCRAQSKVMPKNAANPEIRRRSEILRELI